MGQQMATNVEVARYASHIAPYDISRARLDDEVNRAAPRGMYVVDAILGHCYEVVGGRRTPLFLVKWSGHGHEHDSLHDPSCFPNPHAILNAYLA